MISDTEGNIVFGNEPLHKITGITPYDYKNKERKARIHPDDHPLVVKALQELLSSEKTQSDIIENRFIDASENIHWLSGTISKIYYDGKLYLQTVSRDVTDKKIIEEELEKHRNELELLVTERTNDLQTVSEELRSSNEELYSKNKIVHDQYDELSAKNEELSNKNQIIYEQNAELVATMQNLKEAQSQLIQSEKMASLGILTAGVAHVINNPLNFIMGGYAGLKSYFVEHNLDQEEDIMLLLNSIKTGISRASSIVKGLNKFNRQNDNYSESCDVHAILDNCLLMINGHIKNRIVLEKKYTEKNHIVFGNEGKLHQIFLNFFTNASQAIENEGIITIYTKAEYNDFIVVIRDNGCGISSENLQKVTDPFFTTKEPGKGTGLGLYITYNLIKEHNGKMEIESEIGKGTQIRVTLPILKIS
jgi:PAS domain S-box-containing protein